MAHLHLRHLNPFPKNFEEVLNAYKTVLIPEINLGQLALLVQGKFARKVERLNRVQGLPFRASEISEKIESLLGVAK